MARKTVITVLILLVGAVAISESLKPKLVTASARKQIRETARFAYEQAYDSDLVYRWECWWYGVQRPQPMPQNVHPAE